MFTFGRITGLLSASLQVLTGRSNGEIAGSVNGSIFRLDRSPCNELVGHGLFEKWNVAWNIPLTRAPKA